MTIENEELAFFGKKTMKGLDTVESLSAEASASVGLTKTRAFSYKCQ